MEEEEDDLNQPSGLEARLQRVASQRREARKERDALAGQLEAANARIAEMAKALEAGGTLQQELERYQSLERAWATEKAIMGAGITDPEGVEFVRLAYGRLGEDRPQLGEWLAQKEGLPRAVQVYLPKPAEEAPPQTQGTRHVDPNAGAQPFTGAPPRPAGPFRRGEYGQADLDAVWREMGISPPKFD